MVLLKIERHATTPVFQQIIDQIRDMVDQKILKEGDPLPSTRRLSSSLGLDRTTVYRSYMELTALGYVDSRPGAYTRIRKRNKVVNGDYRHKKGIINWDVHSNPESGQLYEFFLNFHPEKATELPEDFINLSPLDLDHRTFPIDDFRRSLNQVLVNIGPQVLCYGSYQGELPLRQDIAQRLQIHGVSIIPDEILITNGAQQAIELIFKLLGKPGKSVAIESPTYANVIPLIRHHGMNIMEIPVNEKGMDLNQLEQEITIRVMLL